MRHRSMLTCGTALTGVFLVQGIASADTVTYTYDALGRLVISTVSGGPTGQANTNVGYDPAGNRTTYQVSTNGGSTPTPSPTPTPTNNPPVGNADILSMPKCSVRSKDVLANDTDPDGHYPLALTGVSSGSRGTAWVANTTTISYESGSLTGNDVLTYTVRDALGATSTGRLTVTITNSGVCQ